MCIQGCEHRQILKLIMLLRLQMLKTADNAFFMGLIDSQQRLIALAQQLDIAQRVHLGEYHLPVLIHLQFDMGLGALLVLPSLERDLGCFKLTC